MQSLSQAFLRPSGMLLACLLLLPAAAMITASHCRDAQTVPGGRDRRAQRPPCSELELEASWAAPLKRTAAALA